METTLCITRSQRDRATKEALSQVFSTPILSYRGLTKEMVQLPSSPLWSAHFLSAMSSSYGARDWWESQILSKHRLALQLPLVPTNKLRNLFMEV